LYGNNTSNYFANSSSNASIISSALPVTFEITPFLLRSRFKIVLLVLGGGGAKNVRALQDDPKLKKENYLLREISERLSQAMQDGGLKWNNNFSDFIGDFTFDNTDDNEDF
jgi:hypothetical protein